MSRFAVFVPRFLPHIPPLGEPASAWIGYASGLLSGSWDVAAAQQKELANEHDADADTDWVERHSAGLRCCQPRLSLEHGAALRMAIHRHPDRRGGRQD